MKKRYLIILILSFILGAPLVDATSVDLSLSCNDSVKKQGQVSCTVKANITDGELASISGNIVVDSNYFTSSITSFNETTGFSEGTDIGISSFTLDALNLAGLSQVKVTSLEGLDGENNPVTINNIDATITKNIKILDNKSDLNDIKIDGSTINGFAATTYTYTQNVNKETISITTTKPDTATVVGVGDKKLKCGSNTFELVSTAEDGTTKKYTLNLNRTCSADVKLKAINLSSGTLAPAFKDDTKLYRVEVSKDIDKISVTGTKNHDRQTISGEVNDKALEYGENTIKLTVTAENGDKTTYTVIVNREDTRNNNNELLTLTLSAGRLNFNSSTTEYTTKVLYDVTEIEIDAQAKYQTSKVEITGNKNLKVGENTIVIKVTSEKGESQEYKIIVNRLEEGQTLGDNPNIEDIKIEGYDFAFSKDETDYVLKIEKEKKLNLNITMQEASATYTIEGNDDLKNGSVITIKTTSADGMTNEYTIKIEKSTLSIIIIIAAASIVIAAGLITLVIIKSKGKKEKTDHKTKEVKTKVVKDKALIEKVEKQLKMAEEKATTEPVVKKTIEPTIDLTNNEVEYEEDLSARQMPRPTSINIQPISIQSQMKKQEEKPVIRPARAYPVDEDEYQSEATKICTICGHRVPASTKLCPYCKRTWN